ncbi:MAG: DsbA family protein [Gemmatimonadetes bacterium]|nr:DsbA family protein [Gemmatimonadota bacterium]
MRLLYIADPMCSWCWGFSPVIGEIARRYEARLEIDVLMGGLRPGTTEPMDDAMRADIRGHWEHVRDASGQPFDFSFFERPSFVYDTEPPCRAVVVARTIDPDGTLGFLADLQRAFYAENRDVTSTATLLELAADAGFDATSFETSLRSEETRDATRADFAVSRRLGVRGFPTTLAMIGERPLLVASGFRPIERLIPTIDDCLSLADD